MTETTEQRPTRRKVQPYNGIRTNTQPLCPEFWNSGQLSLLGAEAVWYELAFPAPQDPLVEPPESDI